MSNRASILCSVGLMCQVSAAFQGIRASRIPSARYATLACIGMLQSLPAFASKEGAAVADAVQVIVLTAVSVLWVGFSFLYTYVLNPAAGQ